MGIGNKERYTGLIGSLKRFSCAPCYFPNSLENGTGCRWTEALTPNLVLSTHERLLLHINSDNKSNMTYVFLQIFILLF